MRQFTCECPSGLVLTMREFKVADEDLVANPKQNKKKMAQVALLNAITTGIEDSGPYGFEGKVNWLEVLQGDTFYALMKARIETWGPDLQYTINCPTCRCVTRLEVNLEDFAFKPLPPSSLPHVKDPKGTPLAVKLPHSGKRVEFRLLRGKDERKLQKLQKESASNLSSALIRYRVSTIEGINPAELSEYIRQEMSGRDVQFLRAAFDEHDCGVDTETQFECDTCNNVWIDDLRIGKDFLFPRLRGKATTNTSETTNAI